MLKRIVLTIFCSVLVLSTPLLAAKEQKEVEKQSFVKKSKMEIPSSVLVVGKENTYPNAVEDQPTLQPSELTTELLATSNVAIENPRLIKMFNESSMNKTPMAIGLRATIYLGEFALNYDSGETAANWEYQKINTNYVDNRGGKTNQQMHYVQELQKTVKGGLTAQVPNADDVKKMMMLKAGEKSGLPLAFETVIGAGTKKDQVYNIAPKRLGYLYAYAPAINEKGKITYGEVYLVFKGMKRMIVVKNVTSQGIGAWIPIQDHVSFGFVTSDKPR